jgi:predicted nucleotidyltransferase
MPDREPSSEQIEAALKRAVVALREARVPYLLGGSLASWARGGPQSRHDLDLIVKPEDAERALAALADAGMRTERPPEDWLFKAWTGDVLVDLIFHPKGIEVSDEVIERGERVDVLGMSMRVMTLEDLLVTKLLALDEHSAGFETLIGIARALREQVDWSAVRARTDDSPFARAFFVILEGLGILESAGAERTTGARIRVGPGLSALDGGRES